MTKALSRDFNEKYELLKKRSRDAVLNSRVNTQIQIKTLDKIKDKSGSSNSDLGRDIDTLLSEITLTDESKGLLKGQYAKVQDYYKNILFFTKEQILDKANQIKGNSDLDIYLVTALMNKANKIVTGYELRPAQILSTLEFFRENESSNKFCQVNTGEGKTTLTSLIAVIKALRGDTVDVITSNGVLAEDAVREREDFYALFGFTVAHNNVEHEEERKNSYKHDIVYGTIGNFEFDYLKQRTKLSEVKGSREFGSLIIDEADNVVLDNATHIAKLSRPVAGMEYLKYVYLNIWQAVIGVERVLGLQDTEIDYITIEDKKFIKEVISINKKDIISNSLIPKFLENYVDRKIDSWISNAIHARYDYHQDQNYLIGKKDSEKSNLNAEENVIPLDVGVGVTLQNTIWTDLHPFIQLKHNLQVTPDSLSSVFIANSEYIRLYKSVSGLTGTLGSDKEREIIKILYKADSTIIPTYKAGMMEYESNKLVDDEDWAREIARDAIEHAVAKNRAALVVCETVQDVLDLEKQLGQDKRAKVIAYRDEHDAYKIESINKTGGIEPGTIVIATNIGGRGTDIKLSDVVKANGGLHECTAFIASSSRILKQASGRAARQGEAGSSKMIVKKSDLERYNIKLDDNFSNEDVYAAVDVINDRKISGFIPRIKRVEKDAKYFSKFVDLYTKNKLLGINDFVLEDFKLEWALAFDARNIPDIKKVFAKLEEAAGKSRDYKHQFINPYFAIKYVDSILSKGLEGEADDKESDEENDKTDKLEAELEKELYERARYVLSQECITTDPELFYAAGMKNLEVIISQRQRSKLKQLADGIIVNTKEEIADKEQVKIYLENAQKILTKRVKYLENIIDSKNFHQMVLSEHDLNNGGENCMLKHIGSKYTISQLQLQHVNNLIDWINNSSNESLCISAKYSSNELISLKGSIENVDLVLKVYEEELRQSNNLGEDAFYSLNGLPDVTINNPVTKAAISGVASAFAKKALSYTFSKKSSIPTSSDLVDSGIFDIMKVILSQPEDSKSKEEDVLLDELSFGFGSMIKTLRILSQVSHHVSETIGVSKSIVKQLTPQIKGQLETFSKKCNQIVAQGLLKTPKKAEQETFDEARALEGNDVTKDHDINGINSYFSKYTIDAIKSILELRLKDTGINQISNVKVVSNNYLFIGKDDNNIADLFKELDNSTDSSIILAPLNLSNRHAVGLIFKKQHNSLEVYYSDSENHEIPFDLAQILKEHHINIKQLAVETQKYANCGPEVIENFMLYLTGNRLTQEEAILHHSLLVERELLSTDNDQAEYQAIIEQEISYEDMMNQLLGHVDTTNMEPGNCHIDIEVSALGLSPEFDNGLDILS